MNAFRIVLAVAAVTAAPTAGQTVPTWGRWEQSFTAAAAVAPDTDFVAELTAPSGKKHAQPGFWDGAATWRVRFMPDEAGTWSWRTRSAPPAAGLDGQAGTFECRPGEPATPLLKHGAVRVAAGGTYLEHADGTPFFWLGDTVWSGPALSSLADWSEFLADRAGKRFNVIQFNTTAPWRNAPTDRDGQTAFTGGPDVRINPKYFQRLDGFLDAINACGMLAAPVLIWANRPQDPGNALPEADVIRIVRYQLARYGAHHVVWVLAGDNGYRGAAIERWKRIGRAVFGDGARAPVTTHPTGMNWPWEDWRGEKWLTVLGYQSGHGDDARALRWIHSGPVAEHGAKAPPRPIINLEPPYEDHNGYQSKQPHPAYNVRRAVYWSLLAAPPAGVTYGAHGIWSWQTEPGQTPRDHPATGIAKVWREAAALPGSTDMKHLAALFATLDWWRLRPAPELLAGQPGGDDPARHVSAARTLAGDLALAYLPVGGRVILAPRAIAAAAVAEWFDPRTGRRAAARPEPAGTYTAPDAQDWLLVLRQPEARAPKTRVALQQGKWHLNGAVTYPGAKAEGLLMNVRMVNAVFEDRNRPDFDPEANADRFIARIPDYVAHGVRAFTLCLQGGMPGYEGAVCSALEPDGTLRPAYLRRVARVIEACDRHGAAVILGCYYQRQDQILKDEAAVRAGVVNVVKWVRECGFTNVVLEIANEFPHGGFDHRILRTPEGQAELIRLAKKSAPELLVSTSGLGSGRLPDAVAEASDFLLIHFNSTQVGLIPERIRALKKFGKPIVCNEDDKAGAEAVKAAEACVANGASYGLMLNTVNQYFPLRFQGSADDATFYKRLRELTAP